MRWRRGYRSRNVTDLRGSSTGRRGMPMGLAGGGIGGIIVVVLLVLLGGNLFGGDGAGLPSLDPFPAAPGADPGGLPVGTEEETRLVEFVSFVLDDAQATWASLFEASGQTYRPAELVVFRDAVESGCGYATSDVGPFYCGADETIYLDLGFFRELSDRFGAPGDFAQAYVIAHEVAHHVQNQLGISAQVQSVGQQEPDRVNELSIKQELQADCFAGVWGHSTYERDILESGDLQEGLDAAAAVGDDRIQREATGSINPDTWTHGSSEERMTWFRRGFDSGDANSCDTFED